VNRIRELALDTLTLFSSLGTLLCCALPALLVSLGAGAAMVSLVTAMPQLVFVSERKVPLFVGAGCMLALSSVSYYRTRNEPCPIQQQQRRSCLRMRRWSLIMLSISLLAYTTGFFFAFVAAHL
jgi:hypothetical protein